MKFATALLAVCLVSGLAATAHAKKMSDKPMMMTPTMEQCRGGYMKSYSKDMHWSKSKFKKSCKKMMKREGMMKKDMSKDGMMKKDKM